MIYCTHTDCRADTVQELQWLAPLLGKAALKDACEKASVGEVRCRHVPRKGGVAAPFPGEADVDQSAG